MAIRKSQIIITALGAALLPGSWFSFSASLKHANLSYLHWVDPPMTLWDRFWMTIPAQYSSLIGLILLITALIRFATQKSP
jgi:hypothetical protein